MGADLHPSCSTLILLPADGLRKQKIVQVLAPLYLCRRPGKSSWLRVGLILAAAAIWGMKQWMEDLSPILPLK